MIIFFLIHNNTSSLSFGKDDILSWAFWRMCGLSLAMTLALPSTLVVPLPWGEMCDPPSLKEYLLGTMRLLDPAALRLFQIRQASIPDINILSSFYNLAVNKAARFPSYWFSFCFVPRISAEWEHWPSISVPLPSAPRRQAEENDTWAALEKPSDKILKAPAGASRLQRFRSKKRLEKHPQVIEYLCWRS